MNISPFTLILALLAAVLWIIRNIKNNNNNEDKNNNKPPQVPYYIPFIGSLIPFMLNPKKFIENCFKKYGNVFTLKILGYDLIYLHGPEANDFFFSSAEENLSFIAAVAKVLGPFLPQGLFSRMRNDIFSAALSKPKFPHYVQLMEGAIHRKLNEWETKGNFEVFDFFLGLAFDLNNLCFSPDEILNDRYDYFKKLFFEADPQVNTKDLIISIIKRENKCEQVFTKIEAMIKEIIDERIRTGKEEIIQDFIKTCLDKSPRENGEINYRDAALALYGFLFAAQTNTFALFSWTLIHLLQNKPLYDKVVDEQNEVIAKFGHNLSVAALDSMTYLGNCLLEAGRLEINAGAFRLIQNAQVYNGLVLNKGNLVTVYTPSVHRSEQIYTKPDTFDPDRFTRNEHLKFQHGHIVFGGGPHACLGKRFVMLELKSALSIMMRQLDMSLETTNIKRHPSQVFFVGRPTHPVFVKYTKKI